MRQLITRVDDALLEKVKARARAEGVSVNTFVNRLLARAAEADDRRAEIDRRIDALGLRVHIEPPEAPSLEAVLELGRGAGSAVSDALDWARGPRP